MKLVLDLREKYPVFTYQKYQWQIKDRDLIANWAMQVGDINFCPQLKINNVNGDLVLTNKKIVDNFIFHLGLAEIPSYWKATCSPVIKINTGYLNQDQITWWKKLFRKGMGQYYYENQIDFQQANFLNFKTNLDNKTAGIAKDNLANVTVSQKILLAMGGGKDSAVALDILSPLKSEVSVFILNSKILPAGQKVAKIAQVKDIITVERNIDPELIRLNKEGFLNGHTPFSSYLAFLSIFLGYLFAIPQVVFANERSSNEANINYLGEAINHQYSKAFEFENDFRVYNQKYLSNVNYYSLLRPFYELQIAKIFATKEKYFYQFKSCNKKASINEWCDKCPKCLSVYLGLSPFVSEEKLLKIFGHDLLKDQELLPIFLEMLGEKGQKPFECVGTFKETLVAVYLSVKRNSQKPLPILLDYAVKNILPKYPQIDQLAEEILFEWDDNNNVPKEFVNLLKTTYENS